MPTFIKDPWDPSNIPPTKSGKFPAGVEPADGTDCLVNWILNSHDLRIDRKDQIEAVKSFLAKEYNVTNKVGAVGMCWGAKVCFNAAGKGLIDAVAACHGSFLNKDDAEQCDVPMCLLNSKDEPELYEKDIKPVLNTKAFKDKNVFKNYPTMHHGVSMTTTAFLYSV
jgi:dienelactone hydrolase